MRTDFTEQFILFQPVETTVTTGRNNVYNTLYILFLQGETKVSAGQIYVKHFLADYQANNNTPSISRFFERGCKCGITHIKQPTLNMLKSTITRIRGNKGKKDIKATRYFYSLNCN